MYELWLSLSSSSPSSKAREVAARPRRLCIHSCVENSPPVSAPVRTGPPSLESSVSESQGEKSQQRRHKSSALSWLSSAAGTRAQASSHRHSGISHGAPASTPGEGTSDPSWCGAGLSPPWGASHCGNHEIAWLSATSHCGPSFIGVPYPWLPPPPSLDLHPEHLDWSHRKGLGLLCC